MFGGMKAGWLKLSHVARRKQDTLTKKKMRRFLSETAIPDAESLAPAGTRKILEPFPTQIVATRGTTTHKDLRSRDSRHQNKLVRQMMCTRCLSRLRKAFLTW